MQDLSRVFCQVGAALILSLPMVLNAQVFRQGEVLIKLRGGAKSKTATSFRQKVAANKLAKLAKSWDAFNVHHYKSQAGLTTHEMMEMYKSDPAVEFVEPNYLFNKLEFDSEAVTGLSLGDVQTLSGGGSFGQNGANVQAENAWAILSSSGTKPVVAVIDTGVDYNHDVFTQSSSIWTNTGEIAGNGLDDDGNGYIDDVRGWNFVSNTNDPMDDNNHGTHVAGIVLGTTQDIINTVPRDNSKIEIMPLKFLSSTGSGSTADAVEAIYYAVNNGASVINNSWGGSSYSAALHEALAYAYSSGVFLAAAAGNATSNNDTSFVFPANYDVPSQASVASTTDSDAISFFSNFGASTVHVGSPGSGIKSALPGNTYGFLSGTSMASPLVAGTAALIKFERPSMNGFQINQIVQQQAVGVSGLSGKTTTQSRVNIFNAVTVGKSASLVGQPGYTVDASQFQRSIASNVEAGGDAGGSCGLVKSVTGGSGSSRIPWNFIFLLCIPIAVYASMKMQERKQHRRRYERFSIDTGVTMNVGGRQLTGRVNSISEGGVRVNAEDLIEKGSVVTMTITGPDGKETVQVAGNIVWSEEGNNVGVQFAEGQMAQATVAGWTKGLKSQD